MKTKSVILVFGLGLCAAIASAQPVIDKVTNAASYVLAPPNSQEPAFGQGGSCASALCGYNEPGDTPLPNSSIAQGSFFAVFGTGLASSTASIWGNYPLPTNLNGTSIAVTVNGTTTNAIIFYAGPGGTPTQVNAVMPSNTPVGSGTLVVTFNGQSSQPFPITVAPSSFGIFTQNEGGSGPGIIQNNVVSNGSVQVSLNTLLNPALPGSVVTIYGTGLSAVDSSTEGKQPPNPTDLRGSNLAVDVWVGNQKADVAYAGRSGYTALDQVNFTVPAGTTGCYVSVAVYSGPPNSQVVSNFATMAVSADGSPCSDGDGVNMSDLAPAMNANGKVSIGSFSMLSNYLLLSLFGGSFQWDNDTLNGEVATYTTNQFNSSLGIALVPSPNSCAVESFLGLSPVPTDPVLSQLTYLDAGDHLTLQGPSTVPATNPAQVPKNANGHGYGALVGGETISELISGCNSASGSCPPFYLDTSFNVLPGTFTLTGPGGSQVGAFSGSINVPGPLTWNQSLLSNPIDRTKPLTVTWTGGDTNGYVDITGIASSYAGSGTPGGGTPGVIFECIAPTSAGSFTIPQVVLAALPSTEAGGGSLYPTGYLLVGPASQTVKISPTPSGLDGAYLFYHYIQGAPVPWQ